MKEITITVTIPDYVQMNELAYWDKNERDYLSLCVEDSPRSIDLRYVEGLEKRIDALSKTVDSIGADVNRWYDVNRRLEEEIGVLRRTVDSLDRWTDATDGQLKELEWRINENEKRLDGLESANIVFQ